MPFKRLEKPAATKPTKEENFIPSDQQAAIFDAMRNPNAHVMVNALAGVGKSTSMIEGSKGLKGRSGFAAFNKAIAKELKSRVPSGVQADTMHTMGLQIIRRYMGSVELDFDKTEKIVKDLTNNQTNGWKCGQIAKLVSLCKAFLLGGDEGDIEDLSLRFDIDVIQEAYRLVPAVLERAAEETYRIDFDDMQWLPIKMGWNCSSFDTLLLDEAQDVNICQQELALRMAPRLVVVADRFQAIYAFRGGDSEAVDRMHSKLATSGPVKLLPLTVTRRCPQLHVEYAQRLVPSLEALPDAPEGIVRCQSPEQVLAEVRPGDMVLCRTNAPLVSGAYKLIREDRKAVIQGRDIGQGIQSLIRRLKPEDAVDASRKLRAFEEREKKKIGTGYFAEAKAQALSDKCECLRVCLEGLDSISEVEQRIKQLFADIDPSNPAKDAVLFSTVHKAKGMEARKVAILCPEQLPAPWARSDTDKQQERNILYVASTRSKHELVYAGDLPVPFQG